jgi:hypothetical protein
VGIAPNDLEDGHRELRGISEYVKRIGARLDFWSGAETGTEVELTVAACIAYATLNRYRHHQLAQELHVRLEDGVWGSVTTSKASISGPPWKLAESRR